MVRKVESSEREPDEGPEHEPKSKNPSPVTPDPEPDPTPPPPPPSHTVEQLRKAMSGDVSSQLELFTRVSRDLERKARKHATWRAIKAKVEIQDIISEVYERALASGRMTEFDDRGPGSLLRFLSMILDHTMVDTRRRLTTLRRGAGHSVELMDECTDGIHTQLLPPRPRPSTPTGHARHCEHRRLIKEHLSPEEYEIWTLCVARGLTSEEVAKITGRTAASVRGIRFRVKARIKELLH